MPLDSITGCALGLTPDTLSGWRDHSLSVAEMARVGEHIQTCLACQARLAQYDLVAHALRSIEQMDGGRRAPVNPRLLLHQRGQRGRIRIVYPSGLAAMIAALILIGLAGLIPVLEPHRLAMPTPTPVARVTATIDLRASPTGIGSGPWFLDSVDHRAVEVDHITNHVIRSLAVPEDTSLLASAAGSLWIARPVAETVVRLDPNTGRTLTTIALHAPLRGGFAVSPGALWIASGMENMVWHIDTATNQVVAAISVGEFPRMLDIGDGSLWVCEGHDKIGLWRIDLSSNQVVAKIDVSEGEMVQCAGVSVAPNGAVWALNRLNDPRQLSDQSDLLRIDPNTNRVVATVPVGLGMNNPFAATANAIWVVSYQGQTLIRADPRGKQPIATVALGGAPCSISLLDGVLWAQSGVAQSDGSIAPGATVWRVESAS
jgi:hypothetical protein